MTKRNIRWLSAFVIVFVYLAFRAWIHYYFKLETGWHLLRGLPGTFASIASGWIGAKVYLFLLDRLNRGKDRPAPNLDHSKHISKPPGGILSGIGHFFLTHKAFDSVIVPLLADHQFEYFEALKEGHRWRARYLRCLYAFLFFKAAGLDSVLKLVGDVWSTVRGQVKK